MNKKGFISMTLVYTFLILFLFLTLAILNTYSNKNKFLDAIDDKINDDINSFNSNKVNLISKIFEDNTPVSDNNIVFHKISNLSVGNGNGLFYTDDINKVDLNNDGVGNRIYYFRGEVENNYLVFNNLCWRIIRTNEEGSIRIRYDGKFENGACPKTGTRVNINTSSYNINSNNETSVKYMDGDVSSNIKSILDEWYLNNIDSSDFSSIVNDSIFCNNTKIFQENTGLKYYDSRSLVPTIINQNLQINNLSFVCDNKDDRYTLNSELGGSNITGNMLLDYTVGLLTIEDAMLAGGVYGISNNKYYLNTGYGYWTMSPYSYDTQGKNIYIKSDGTIAENTVNTSLDIIPVISISSNAIVNSGDGKYNSPYILE